MVCLPPKKSQKDGCHEAGSQLCWGEDKVEEIQSQQLSPVYHREIGLEGQVRLVKEGGGGREVLVGGEGGWKWMYHISLLYVASTSVVWCLLCRKVTASFA